MIIRRARILFAVPLNVHTARELKVRIARHPLLKDFRVYILKRFGVWTVAIEDCPVEIRKLVNSQAFRNFAALVKARNDVTETEYMEMIRLKTYIISDGYLRCKDVYEY